LILLAFIGMTEVMPECPESKVHCGISEVQPQVLRLRLSQKARQTSLRMTVFLFSEL
jgi:hypothetical protein